jgi:hypothetical protein
MIQRLMRLRRGSAVCLSVLLLVPGASVSAGDQALIQDCRLPPQHGGITFPVETIEREWACRIQILFEDYTAIGVMGPVQTPLPPSLYGFFLDHPVLTAGLANRLELGPFQAQSQGPGRFWVNDGDGTQGHVTLLQQSESARIYYMEGFHEGRIFPKVNAKAVVFLRLQPAKGGEEVDNTIVSYVRLESRMLSAMVRMLRPLLGDAIIRKLARGFDATNRLSQILALDASRVLSAAETLPGLDPVEVEALRAAVKPFVRSRTSIHAPILIR